MERKANIKKFGGSKNKITASRLLFIGLAFLLTAALFIGLVVLQNFLMEDVTYKQVLVAKEDIPENTIITQANAEQYLTFKNINILDATNGDMTSADALLGQQLLVPIYKGELVTEKDFENVSEFVSIVEDPIEVSIPLDAIANSDGGKIRAGDVVNVTMMYSMAQLYGEELPGGGATSINNSLYTPVEEDFGNVRVPSEEISEESTEEADTEENRRDIQKEDEYEYAMFTKYVMENLYVTKVLDSAGVELAPTDTESSAGIVIAVIEKEEEEALNNALANCSLMRVSKVLDKEAALKEKKDAYEAKKKAEEAQKNSELLEEVAEEVAEESLLVEYEEEASAEDVENENGAESTESANSTENTEESEVTE